MRSRLKSGVRGSAPRPTPGPEYLNEIPDGRDPGPENAVPATRHLERDMHSIIPSGQRANRSTDQLALALFWSMSLWASGPLRDSPCPVPLAMASNTVLKPGIARPKRGAKFGSCLANLRAATRPPHPRRPRQPSLPVGIGCSPNGARSMRRLHSFSGHSCR